MGFIWYYYIKNYMILWTCKYHINPFIKIHMKLHIWKSYIQVYIWELYKTHMRIVYKGNYIRMICGEIGLVCEDICEELVLSRYRCQWQNCEELESSAKYSRFGGGGGILSMWGIHMYAKWKLTSCIFFTKCDILVRNMWPNGNKFTHAVRSWYQFFKV